MTSEVPNRRHPAHIRHQPKEKPTEETTDNLLLELNPNELCSLIEALYGMIRTRLLITLRPTPEWKDLNWHDVQAVLDTAVSGYAKAVMTFREKLESQVVPEFLATFSIPSEVWDLPSMNTG